MIKKHEPNKTLWLNIEHYVLLENTNHASKHIQTNGWLHNKNKNKWLDRPPILRSSKALVSLLTGTKFTKTVQPLVQGRWSGGGQA